mmetsp:Transcript_30248/g.96649  ORF Transcript_30248/g.96649 Transcript_30248/m.96649 type:complete len:245 (+) Transcript_30248:79-813(+)
MRAGSCTHLLCLAAWALAVTAQVGGLDGLGEGVSWTPPPADCTPFTCPAGQKPVAREGAKVWAYGCKDTAAFNPNDPSRSLKSQKSVDKCCVEKEICLRTCRMPLAECHDLFQRCSQRICEADQRCWMMAQVADFSIAPVDDEQSAASAVEGRKCSAYIQAQKEVCECVPEDEWQDEMEARLKSFYQKYNPEKLDKGGEVKDKKIWESWEGKEPKLFFELTKKYKRKAVEIRVKPKPGHDKGEL